MNKSIFLKLSYLSLFVVIFHSFGISQDMNKISLDGKWKFRKAGTTKWMEAIVPGEVHLDLLKNKVITDPFMGDNEQFQQWIGEIGWEYEKIFFIPDTLFVHRNIDLVFQGLDTYANVFLNDSLILVADNMFRTWYAAIKPLLRTGMNTLRVQFPSVVSENKSRYSKLSSKLPGDEKVVCRKAAYQFGGDWGPAFITSGIWKSVYIRTWDFVNVLGVRYIQKSLSDSLASLTAEITILSTLADSSLIKLSLNGDNVVNHWTVLNKGTNIIPVDFVIRNPKRWWTNGLGEPYLYTCEHEVYFAGRLSGKGTTRIGLRTIELVQKKDSIGRSFYFKMNDVPVFMKGANYIPQDNFLTRVQDSNYLQVVKNAAAANMNMLRVWGGGIYEKDAFYDYCDEYGILVWQDFMFADAMYPGTKKFLANVQAEAVQNIVRLRNHPCIALWCGNSGIDESWKSARWSGKYDLSGKDSADIKLGYITLFSDVLRNAAIKFDPEVPYIQTTPRAGIGGAQSLKDGNIHYWGVWDGKQPFTSYKDNVGRFVSEFGFPAYPEMATVRRFTTPADLRFGSPVMKAHMKSTDGDTLIQEYLLRDYNKPKNFESFIYVSQLLQAEGIKTAIEAYRRAMPYCMGSLYWQLNDCWPGVSSSAIDYYGRKKAMVYRMKNDYAATLVSPVIEGNRLKIYVVSDKLSSQKADLSIELVDFSGKTLMQKSIPVEIPSNSSSVVFDTDLKAFLKNRKTNEILLLTSLKDGDKVLSENSLYFDPPKKLNLQVPTIQKEATEIPEGYKIELSTDQLAKDVFLKMPFKGELSDNYFDLIPGRTKTLIYTCKTRFEAILSLARITTLIDTYQTGEK
jgi:beta-mannosidase